jgi:hypothetical protein
MVFAYFAYCLLSGQVLPLPNKLAFPATQMLESSNLTSKVTRLIGRLKAAGIESMQKLRSTWTQDSTYLQQELQAWYTADGKAELFAKWA